MRQRAKNGNFLINLLFNILLNLEGFIPAIILIILHFVLGLSLWWAALAAALFVLSIIVRMMIIGYANKCGNTPEVKHENKNPYSIGNKQK